MSTLTERVKNLTLEDSDRRNVEGEQRGDIVEGGLPIDVFGDPEGPERIVVLLFQLHGERREDIPPVTSDLSDTAIYSRPANVCVHFKPSSTEVYDKVSKIRMQQTIPDKIHEFQSTAPAEMDRLREQAALAVTEAQHLRHTEISLEGRLRSYMEAPDHYVRRAAHYDHLYEYEERTTGAYASGIFIVGSNFNKALFAPVPNLADHFIAHLAHVVPFPEIILAQRLQSFNLCNTAVLQEISRRITGDDSFVLDHHPLEQINFNNTGIQHYAKSTLTQYLNYFKKMGIKVIVLDSTCQVNSFKLFSDKKLHGSDLPEAASQRPIIDPSVYRDKPDSGFESDGGYLKRKKTRRRKSRRRKSLRRKGTSRVR